jgi:hypothetical protein
MYGAPSVPAYTKTVGTILLMVGNEILIQPNAELAYIDPQNFYKRYDSFSSSGAERPVAPPRARAPFADRGFHVPPPYSVFPEKIDPTFFGV